MQCYSISYGDGYIDAAFRHQVFWHLHIPAFICRAVTYNMIKEFISFPLKFANNAVHFHLRDSSVKFDRLRKTGNLLITSVEACARHGLWPIA